MGAEEANIIQTQVRKWKQSGRKRLSFCNIFLINSAEKWVREKPTWQPLIKSEVFLFFFLFLLLCNPPTQLAWHLFPLLLFSLPARLSPPSFLFPCLSAVLKPRPICPFAIHPLHPLSSLFLRSSAPITPPSHLLPSAASPASSTLALPFHFFFFLPLWNACCWSIRLAAGVCSHSFLTVSKVSLSLSEEVAAVLQGSLRSSRVPASY